MVSIILLVAIFSVASAGEEHEKAKTVAMRQSLNERVFPKIDQSKLSQAQKGIGIPSNLTEEEILYLLLTNNKNNKVARKNKNSDLNKADALSRYKPSFYGAANKDRLAPESVETQEINPEKYNSATAWPILRLPIEATPNPVVNSLRSSTTEQDRERRIEDNNGNEDDSGRKYDSSTENYSKNSYDSYSDDNDEYPKWSSFPIQLDAAIHRLRKNLDISRPISRAKGMMSNYYPPSAHYALLLTVVRELVAEGHLNLPEADYQAHFDHAIINAVDDFTNDSEVGVNRLELLMDSFKAILSPILEYINKVIESNLCTTSVQCDIMIDNALRNSTNVGLKIHALCLEVAINFIDIFMAHHADVFEQIAQQKRAFNYVFIMHPRDLRPLLVAGSTLRKVAKYLS